ncbi:MAG TPA: LCP family protein [Candidatus Sulfotelmatobacter sp.]|nr:LCP family protein [Candidatus Sulfotelmatobacter sp.]
MRKNKRRIAVTIFVLILAILFFIKTASIYPFLFHLVFDSGVNLKQTDNKINILLLGIGGGSHDGPNLTDTIILANLDPRNNKVTLVSIPRDLWVPDLTGSVKKINTAYADGESIRKGGGLSLAEAVVGKVTKQEIDYAVRIDFSGFVKAIDVVGGLDINVDNVLDDYAYPISGKEDDNCGYSNDDIQAFIATQSSETEIQQKFSCRYKHLHFDKGLNHMDGETALEYVRSRHALGNEGSDFARSKRQENVINAFKDKLLSAQTFINPTKIISLYSIVRGSVDTNVKQDEFDDFIRLGNKLTKAKIQNAVIDIGDSQINRQGLLMEAPISSDYDYLSVLVPRIGNGNFKEIQDYISCEISKGICSVPTKPNY